MRPVGIIANPSSGKDIRRLVAHGSVFPNNEKINVVRRVLLGIDACGVDEVLLMPDHFGICRRAVDGLGLKLKPTFLDMIPEGEQNDSTHASKMMVELGAGAIVVLGGDGTNRVVAKESEDVPLVSIATGTNNVFSSMVEGTMAGVAAGLCSLSDTNRDQLSKQVPRLEVYRSDDREDNLIDIALIDVVVSSHNFVGARAVWDVEHLREVFLTRAVPGNIGFSSLGGLLTHLAPDSGLGLHIRIGPGDIEILAPIAPGLMRYVPIKSHTVFDAEKRILVETRPSVLALDGEREITVKPNDNVYLAYSPNGPYVVDLEAAFQFASEEGLFVREQKSDSV